MNAREHTRSPSAVSRCFRAHGVALFAVIAVAAIARAVAFNDLRGSIYFRGLLPDEGVYDGWARAIASGSELAYLCDFPRLPALIFAGVYRLLGADQAYARGFDVVVGVAAVAAIYACGAELGGRRVAIVAGGLAALSRGLVFHSVTLHTTALSILLAASVLWAVLRAVARPERRSPLKAALCGALLGLAVNVRPNLAVLLPVVAALLWFAARRAKVASRTRVLALAALGLAYVGCAVTSGGVVGPAFGFNLYLGNDPSNPEPFFRPAPFAASDPSRQSVGFTLEASRREGRVLTSDEANSYFAHVVLAAAKRAPGAFVHKLAQKALLVLHHEVPANNHNFGFLAGQLPSLRAPWVADWLLLVLGVLGLAFGSSSNARMAGRWIAGAYAASLVLFFVEERLRAPLIAMLVPFAALAVVQGWERFSPIAKRGSDQQERASATPTPWPLLASAALLCALSWWPLPGADGLSTAYNLHALLLYDANRLEEAERFYRRSAELGEQDSPGAYLGLAAIYEQRGDWKRALLTLAKVPDRDYKAAAKYQVAGNIAAEQKMLREASIAYEKALALDGSILPIYRPLSIVYQLLGQNERAKDVIERGHYAESFYGL